jgi:hypothetical protein
LNPGGGGRKQEREGGEEVNIEGRSRRGREGRR